MYVRERERERESVCVYATWYRRYDIIPVQNIPRYLRTFAPGRYLLGKRERERWYQRIRLVQVAHNLFTSTRYALEKKGKKGLMRADHVAYRYVALDLVVLSCAGKKAANVREKNIQGRMYVLVAERRDAIILKNGE